MIFSPRLATNVDYYNDCYNKKIHLVYLSRLPGYHTHSTYTPPMAHHLQESAEYALLLAEQKPEEKKRINDIVSRIISMQDLNPQSNTYGYYPYYYEEPLTKHVSPDITVTITITAVILQLLKHEKLFDDVLLPKIKSACLASAFCIPLAIENIQPYSHMQFFASYVLISCGKQLQKDDILKVGLSILNHIYFGISYNNNIWEYGAEYETLAISEILSLMQKEIPGNDCTIIASKLYDIVWSNIASQYHAPTGCIAHVQSNKQPFFSHSKFMEFLEKAVGIKASDKSKRQQIPFISKCPKKYIPAFFDEYPNSFKQSLVCFGTAYPHFGFSKVVSTYMQPMYSLSSFNHEEFGSYNIPFTGCFGERTSPFTFRLLVLHDNYEFCSAQLHCVQSNSTAVGHIVFSTNRGDEHPIFSKKQGKIKASSFIIRLEICGNADELEVNQTGSLFSAKKDKVTLNYEIPYINLAEFPIKFRTRKSKHRVCFDAFIDSEDTFELDFTNIAKAICQFNFRISASGKPMEDVKNSFKNKIMVTELTDGNHNIKLETPVKPDYFEYLMTNDRQYINNIPLDQYSENLRSKTMQYKYLVSENAPIELPALDTAVENEIEHIKTISVEEIQAYISDILEKLISMNYALNIFKRHVVQITMNLFERMSSENFRLKKNINTGYTDTYQKINSAVSEQDIQKCILKVTKKLISAYTMINLELSKKNIITDVISIIDQNYQNPDLSLKMVAQMTGVTETYISHAFADHTDTSYIKYLTYVRIEKSKKLLIENPDVEEALKQCGYLNLSSFRRRFKQCTGSTVSEWLKQQK